jgi:small ligand-binding sensory domain FIST
VKGKGANLFTPALIADITGGVLAASHEVVEEPALGVRTRVLGQERRCAAAASDSRPQYSSS